MDAAFLRAAYPRSFTCLGCRLVPLTFGHWFLLNELCPFFTDREERTSTPDLPIAVFICSRPYREAERDLKRWWTPLLFRVWGHRVGDKSFRDELETMTRYMRENSTGPVICIPSNAKKTECGGPWVWRLYSQMLSIFHMTEQQARDTPILRGLCLEAAHNEHHRHINLAHSNHRLLIRHLREKKARANGLS